VTLKNDWVTGDQFPATAANAVANEVALKAPLASPAFTGTPTGITKAHVGLGNVDNTSDEAKPVSTAQQAALDGKQRHNAVDIRDYIVAGSPLGAAGTVFDIAAVVGAMEVGGGECWIPPGDWTPNAYNVGLNETLVTTSPSDVPSVFTYKFRGAGKHSRITLPGGMNTGDYLLIANSSNANTYMPHPKLVFEDIGVKSSTTFPSGSFRSLNAGFLKVNQRSFTATRVYFDKIMMGFYATGYCDLVRLEQVYWANNITAGGWAYQGTSTGDGLVIDQLFCNGNAGISLRGCLGANIRGCIGGWHEFNFSTVALEGCHFEGDQTTSATPVVSIKSSNVDVFSGAYYAKKYRPSFSINDSGSSPSRVVFHENILFVQPINDPANTLGAAKCVDVDIANMAPQSEIIFKGCKSGVQYGSTALGTGGSAFITHLGPLVTASGVSAIQTALTAAPLRTAMQSVIRSTGGGAWEIVPTNRLPIPTKAIGAMALSGAAVTAASAFVTTDGSNGTYYYKAWALDVVGRNTAPSSEVSVTTTSGNPIAALTFNAGDAPAQLLIERGTVSGTYTSWALITVTDMAQTLYDQGLLHCWRAVEFGVGARRPVQWCYPVRRAALRQRPIGDPGSRCAHGERMACRRQVLEYQPGVGASRLGVHCERDPRHMGGDEWQQVHRAGNCGPRLARGTIPRCTGHRPAEKHYNYRCPVRCRRGNGLRGYQRRAIRALRGRTRDAPRECNRKRSDDERHLQVCVLHREKERDGHPSSDGDQLPGPNRGDVATNRRL
jgi:hypothetical protein